jgi:cyanophycinase
MHEGKGIISTLYFRRLFFCPMTETMHEALPASRTDTQSHAVTDSPQQIRHGMRSFRAFVAAALLSVLPTGASTSAGETQPVQPVDTGIKGSLVIAGGGALPSIIREKFVELAGGKDARIVIIPTASADADIPEKHPIFMWEGLQQSVRSTALFHTRDRLVADDEASTQVLDDATGVWLSGGRQEELVRSYMNTKVIQKIQLVLEKGGVVGGTSAGAAVMSRPMIQGNIKNPLDNSINPDMSEGFGFLPGSIVDQHFKKRNRRDRLDKAMKALPGYVGIGVDEETALVVNRGGKATVIGNSTVSIFAPSGSVELRHGEETDLASFGMPVMQTADGRP